MVDKCWPTVLLTLLGLVVVAWLACTTMPPIGKEPFTVLTDVEIQQTMQVVQVTSVVQSVQSLMLFFFAATLGDTMQSGTESEKASVRTFMTENNANDAKLSQGTISEQQYMANNATMMQTLLASLPESANKTQYNIMSSLIAQIQSAAASS